jgi:hypothetical protein
MATTSKRAAFRPRALECFREQVYPDNWEVDLLVDEHETNTLGRKLNDMAAHTASEFLITWDDDDCHSPTRIARQITPLLTDYHYSGTSKIFYHDIVKDEGWLYAGTPRIWLGGLAWRRSLWEKQKFRDITVGVDTRWQQLAQAEHKAKFMKRLKYRRLNGRADSVHEKPQRGAGVRGGPRVGQKRTVSLGDRLGPPK